jgi:hypothetical protein
MVILWVWRTSGECPPPIQSRWRRSRCPLTVVSTTLLAREFGGLPSGVQVHEMAPRLIGQMNGILFALGSRPVAGAMVGIQERESGGAWGAELPTYRAGPRTRSRVFCVIGPPVRALEETSRQLAWLALASGAADPNPGADVFAPLVVNRIGLISGRPSRSSKGVSTYFRVGQGMRLSGWGHLRRAMSR